MATIHVTDLDGVTHTIEGQADGRSIMSILLDAGLEVGLCGGNSSCGTCCGVIDQQWGGILPETRSAETDMTDSVKTDDGVVRLTCQIPFVAGLEDIRIRLTSIE